MIKRGILNLKKDIAILCGIGLLTIVYFWRPIFLGQTFVTQDLNTFYFPLVSKVSQMFRAGELWFWNPWLFGGFPFLANISYALFYPFNWLSALMPIKNYLTFDLTLHSFLSGAFMYLFMRSIKQSRLGSLISALIFMFAGSSLASNIGGTTTKHTEIWLPLVLFFAELRIRFKKEYLSVILGVVLAVQFLAGHTLTSVFIFACFVYYYLFRSFYEIRENGRKESINLIRGLLISVLISVGIWAVQLLPTLEMSQLSFRGQGLNETEIFYPNSSLSAISFIQFLIPDFFGTVAMSTNWLSAGGSGYASWAYIGILPLFIIILSLRRPFSRQQVIFLILSCFVLVISVGSENIIYKSLLKMIPALTIFRGPAKSLYLYFFSMAVLAGIAVTKLASNKRFKKMALTVGIILIVASMLILVADRVYYKKGQLIKKAVSEHVNKNILNKQGHPYSAEEYMAKANRIYEASGKMAARTGFIVLLVGIWFILYSRSSSRKYFWGTSAILLICVELFLAKQPFVRYSSGDIYSYKPSVISYFENDKSNYRVLPLVNTLPPNILMVYGIANIKGLDEVYSKWYREYYDAMDAGVDNADIAGNVSHELSNVREDETITDYLPGKLALLNVKYLLSSEPIISDNWKLAYVAREPEGSIPYFVTNSTQTEYFAHGRDWAPTTFAQSTNIYVYENEVSLSMVRRCVSGEPVETEVLEYSNDKIRIQFTMSSPEDIFLSEVFYPGWKAYINGRPAPLIRYNSIFRSLRAVKGENILEMRYEPYSFFYGLAITAVTLLVALSIVIYSLKNDNVKSFMKK